MARHPYPIHTIRLRQPLAAAALETALAEAVPEATLKGEGTAAQGLVINGRNASKWEACGAV